MAEKLEYCIRRIAEKVDFDVVKEAQERLAAAWNFRTVDRPPLIISCPPPEPWPSFKYAETFHDRDKMLVSQLSGVYSHCLLKDDAMPCVRANYGVGIIPSGFGSEIVVQQEINNMPWVKEPILTRDPPSIGDLKEPDPWRDGLLKTALETEEYFVKRLDGTGVHVYLCDTQSSLDIAYLLRGTRLLTDFYKHPDFVKDLMQRVTDVYIDFSKIQKDVVHEPYGQGFHGNPNLWMEKGGVRICEDVAVLLSPKVYRTFCTPFNEMCLKPFAGGLGHFCCSGTTAGRHVLDEVLSNPYVRAFVFGDPAKFYDFGEILRHFQERRVCLVWSDGPAGDRPVEEWVDNIAANLNEKTGVIFSISVRDFKRAKKLFECFAKKFKK